MAAITIIPGTLVAEDTPSPTNDQQIKNVHAIIDRVYIDVLQRYPDERGLYTYSKHLLQEGKGEEWLRNVLLHSEEGQQISKRKQKQKYILYGLATLPFIFLGIIFFFSRNTKDFIFKTLLVVLSLTLSCLFLEIALRLTAAYKDYRNELSWQQLDHTRVPEKNAAVQLRDIIRLSKNPGIIYEFMPDLFVRFMGGQVHTDNKGFRVTPGSCEQSDNTTIIGLGDSVMFGWGVDDPETYLAYLTQNFPEHCFRIINTAVPGYNTTMEVEVLAEKGLQYHPELVIIHYIDNDLYLPNFIRQNDTHITLTRSYLLAALSRWQGTRVRTRPFDHLVRISGEVPEEYKYMVGIDAYRRAITRLKELSRKNNFKILLLSNWSAPDFVTNITSELNIPVIELGDAIQQYSREHPEAVMTISKTDPHYSAIAHRIVADEISQFLRQNTSMAELLTAPKQKSPQE